MSQNNPKIVLIIDSHDDFDNLYHGLLDRMFNVFIAHDKNEGLKQVHEHIPCVIILDLPIEDMRQTIEYCQQEHPELSILVLSNKSGINDLRQYRNVKDVLEKVSFDPRVIIDKIMQYTQ